MINREREQANNNGNVAMTQKVFQWIVSILMSIILGGGSLYITTSHMNQQSRDEAMRQQNAKVESQLQSIAESSIKTAVAVENLAKDGSRYDSALNAISTAMQSISERVTRLEAERTSN